MIGKNREQNPVCIQTPPVGEAEGYVGKLLAVEKLTELDADLGWEYLQVYQ
jgi:hypothetical protein